jgi:tRNA (guanine37-N1)-methyltransferase
MRFDIVTIFPGFFGSTGAKSGEGSGILGHGILERALRQGQAEVTTHDLRSFTHDRHKTVDDRPFGGGEGMVLKAQPIFECLEAMHLQPKGERGSKERVILLSAQGQSFTQATARRLSSYERVVLICGRYEGVDERVSAKLCDEEVGIGDYVLTGGELGAAVIVDAVIRLLPGVLGHADSSRYESFGEGDEPTETMTADGVPRATHGAGGLLDYPHYTRPAEWNGMPIPEALGGGDHLAIRKWRRRAALEKTLANRPDLLETAALSDDDREYLAELGWNG